MHVTESGLPTIEYDYTESPAEVYPRIQEAQRQAPIAIGPAGPEILSYELARAVLRDTRFGIPPGLHLMTQGVTSGPLWDKVTASLLCLEGAEHQRLRSLVSKAFTPRATSRLSETIAAVFNELIDGVADAGRCDVVNDIARPYPVPIICALLGAPREDWQRFSAWVDDMVARRRNDLTEDLLSGLIRAEDQGDRLNGDELRMLAAGLLTAGTDTTRNQLAASVDVLSEHPDQWTVLHDHPELAMSAVEESMRHSPSVCGAPRMAIEDIDFHGYTFPAGTFIYVNTFAANRDPDLYENADRFDITRDEVPAILTFGGGAHYCLGANLAQRELADALTILTRRIPRVHRAGPAVEADPSCRRLHLAPHAPGVDGSGPPRRPVAPARGNIHSADYVIVAARTVHPRRPYASESLHHTSSWELAVSLQLLALAPTPTAA